MTKEELINELKELKQERLEQLERLNITHETLMRYIVELNHIIEEAEKESDNERTDNWYFKNTITHG